MRSINLYLDGEKIGAIGNGKTREFTLEPGEHRLEARIDWCGSQPLQINATGSGELKVEVAGFTYSKWLIPVTFLLIVLYPVAIRLNLNPVWLLVLIIPFLIYIFYFLSFGRNHYLRLRKI